MNGNGNGNGNGIKLFEPKKFLFVGIESLSGNLAWHLAREGNEVKVYFKAKSDSDVYDGFFEKVDVWEPHKDWADVIVFDDVGFGAIADRLRKQGKLVIGGSSYTDRLEMDREFGQAELKRCGVSILPSRQFSDYDEGIKFIKENPGCYVFKPSGNVLSASKDLLFLGQEEDGSDLLELLEQNKKVWQKKAQVFLLQKFIAGVEVAVGAFFNGNDFILPINVNFEHKRIFPGNMGPFTGEMGTLMYWSEPNKLFRCTLEKMLPALRESGYHGYIDIDCIVNGRGIYPLEFTSRFGYPTISIQLEGILTSVGKWMYGMAKGDSFEMKTKKGFQVGVCILVPTYFSGGKDDVSAQVYRDLAITFKRHSNPNLDGIHLEDVKNDNGIWRIAGNSGYILTVTGSGTTVEDARRVAYGRIQNIIVPNMFYRTDIGSMWPSESDKLHVWGYLR